jgi:hypothetical protein
MILATAKIWSLSQIAGSRRLAALTKLAKDKAIPKNFGVPCRVVDEQGGTEASLAENVSSELAAFVTGISYYRPDPRKQRTQSAKQLSARTPIGCASRFDSVGNQ